MDLGIKGKWALVCGASKGLGLGCAQALVREGVHVLIVARGAQALEAAAAQLIAEDVRDSGASVHCAAADITTDVGRAAVFAVRKDFDIVVTNAGGGLVVQVYKGKLGFVEEGGDEAAHAGNVYVDVPCQCMRHTQTSA